MDTTLLIVAGVVGGVIGGYLLQRLLAPKKESEYIPPAAKP